MKTFGDRYLARHATMRGAILAAGVCLALAGCSSERDRVEPTNPTTAEGFTERGWNQFEDGDFGDALADFASAIDLDEDFVDAYIGQGWARLSSATDGAGMLAAVSSFDDAIGLGTSNAVVRGGRAAAQLAIGGASGLAEAVTDAGLARSADPTFTFEHRTSFDTKDLHLIEAFARAAQSSFAAALAAGEQIEDSGIEQGNATTWVVGAETFETFEAATLAFLHKLSQEHAG